MAKNPLKINPKFPKLKLGLGPKKKPQPGDKSIKNAPADETIDSLSISDATDVEEEGLESNPNEGEELLEDVPTAQTDALEEVEELEFEGKTDTLDPLFEETKVQAVSPSSAPAEAEEDGTDVEELGDDEFDDEQPATKNSVGQERAAVTASQQEGDTQPEARAASPFYGKLFCSCSYCKTEYVLPPDLEHREALCYQCKKTFIIAFHPFREDTVSEQELAELDARTPPEPEPEKETETPVERPAASDTHSFSHQIEQASDYEIPEDKDDQPSDSSYMADDDSVAVLSDSDIELSESELLESAKPVTQAKAEPAPIKSPAKPVEVKPAKAQEVDEDDFEFDNGADEEDEEEAVAEEKPATPKTPAPVVVKSVSPMKDTKATKVVPPQKVGETKSDVVDEDFSAESDDDEFDFEFEEEPESKTAPTRAPITKDSRKSKVIDIQIDEDDFEPVVEKSATNSTKIISVDEVEEITVDDWDVGEEPAVPAKPSKPAATAKKAAKVKKDQPVRQRYGEDSDPEADTIAMGENISDADDMNFDLDLDTTVKDFDLDKEITRKNKIKPKNR